MHSEGKFVELKGQEAKNAYIAPTVEILSGQETAGPQASLSADTINFGEDAS